MSVDNDLACDELTELISAYVDGELSKEDSAAVAQHIEKCPGCAQVIERTGALSRRIRVAARFEVPANLPERVRRALPVESQSGLFSALRTRRLHWLGSHVFAATVGALALFLWQAIPQPDPTGEFVSAHVRKLLDSGFKSVDSSDPHTVRPWFAGKIDFAPPVVTLGEAGFPLIGAHIDYVNDRVTAALSYRRRQHPITLFICPVAKQTQAALTRGNDRGYHMVGWQDESFSYWAVSDLNLRELREFTDRIRNNVQGPRTPVRGDGG